MSGAGRPLDLVALDLDGVVWRGLELLPGAREALAEVVARGLDLRYVTNNSTLHRAEVADRLAGYGLPAGPERVITSGSVTAHWLKGRLPAGATVLVVGEEGLLRELREAGLVPVRAGLDALDASGEREEWAGGERGHVQAVVVGMDRSFCYASLAAAQAALSQEEVLFVATNRDNTFPAAQGLLPGAGAIVAAVAAAAGREPVVMGKPSSAMALVRTVATWTRSSEPAVESTVMAIWPPNVPAQELTLRVDSDRKPYLRMREQPVRHE